jgi:hypothetical protein
MYGDVVSCLSKLRLASLARNLLYQRYFVIQFRNFYKVLLIASIIPIPSLQSSIPFSFGYAKAGPAKQLAGKKLDRLVKLFLKSNEISDLYGSSFKDFRSRLVSFEELGPKYMIKVAITYFPENCNKRLTFMQSCETACSTFEYGFIWR